jgi:UDP-N-acetylglucosamine 2-epimerase (non-hydrolysing)
VRVLVVIGTRPEAIKLAPVVQALRGTDGFEVETCATSQHRDLLRPMLDFFRLGCEHDLQVMTPGQTLADVTCRIIQGVSALLRRTRYDWVVVQGDTTTAFAGALAAFYERVRVAHVEAGLRSFNLAHPFPEEANRRFIDVFADCLLVPTEPARDNLLREGADPGRIFLTGNTGIDALLLARDIVRREGRRPPVEVGPGRRLVLVTAHRRESFGEPMERLFGALVELTARRPEVEVLLPLHPNPQVRAVAARVLAGRPRIHLTEPLDYPEFVTAMLAADLILTDSGGVQEEAPALGKPVLVARETTERPEGVAAGAAELVGLDPQRIVARACARLALPPGSSRPIHVYGDGLAAQRVAEVLRRGRLERPFRAAA